MKKQVFFTFDYELFLGSRSGTVQGCLIRPTDALLALFSNVNFKAVFFVDTVYLNKLKKISEQYPSAARDFQQIQTQLKRILIQGHYIFPHIHAHWLDADYLPEENQWSLTNFRYYQFSAVPKELQNTVFEESIAIIKSLFEPDASVNPLESYRAGGWSIQPFSDFKPFFEKFGIVHEWSVIPGKFHISDAHSFDFRTAPEKRSVYRFTNDICKADEKGHFTEWTISTITLSPIEQWINFKVSGILKRLGKSIRPSGATVASSIKEEGDAYQKGNEVRRIASFEGLNPYLIRKYLAVIKRQSYFQFISHPKMLTEHEMGMVKRLLISLSSLNIETDYRKVLATI
jgi:hypothetical protein